jgi:hypothetical protein
MKLVNPLGHDVACPSHRMDWSARAEPSLAIGPLVADTETASVRYGSDVAFLAAFEIVNLKCSVAPLNHGSNDRCSHEHLRPQRPGTDVRAKLKPDEFKRAVEGERLRTRRVTVAGSVGSEFWHSHSIAAAHRERCIDRDWSLALSSPG